MTPQLNRSVSLDPATLSLGHIHHLLLGLIAPRPIAFASTIDAEGNVNLSPFSYFNVFGINPPILIFSPARSVRTLEHKHTTLNVHEIPEVVINLIDTSIVEQASLSSVAYPKGIDEFIKAGLEPAPSLTVRPPRVAAAPASFECVVDQIVPIGEGGGSGNLIICRVQMIHVREDLLTEEGRVNLEALRMVGRMGGNYYVNASGTALFEVEKPNEKKSMGIDALPDDLRESPYLTGAELARLASFPEIPGPDLTTPTDFREYVEQNEVATAVMLPADAPEWLMGVKTLLGIGKVREAWWWYLAK